MSNDDFFSSVGRQGRGQSNTDQENIVSFAHAIAARFGSSDLLTARLIPDEHPPQISSPQIHLRPQKSIPTPSKPPSSSTFTPVNPSDLSVYLADPSTLILDIRPHAAHTAARLHRALSLSIPSTLLKRPLFGLSKLVQMLPSSSARARFAAWPSANHILVYDADSVLVPDSSNIAGLLRKFRAEGFTGELVWVKGGFQAVWREARHCATTDHPSPDEDDQEGTASSGALRTKHLPKAAFSLSTTNAANAASGTPAVVNAANPFFDTIRQNLELSQGITERIPLRLPRRIRRRINDLPFRWLQDIARRSALCPSSSSFPGGKSVESGSESSDDPHESDPDSNDPDVEEGAETLAMQFYRIELAEQRRLRTVMEHHARESEVSAYAAAGQAYTLGEGGQGIVGVGPRSITAGGAKTLPSTPVHGAFPFSITAGVEKGAKNRYNHIWPFEHARVRIHDGRHQGSHPGPSSKRDKEDKKKAASPGGTTTPSSPTFASVLESRLASVSGAPSPNAPEGQGNMLMNVDRHHIRTPSLSGLAPPSSVPMTPFYSASAFHTPLSMPMTPFYGPSSSSFMRGGVPMTFPRGDGGGSDAYFPTFPSFPTVPESSQIPSIPEDAPISLPPRVDTRTQQRSGGFLSPSILSTHPRSPQSAGPQTISPLVMPPYTPYGPLLRGPASASTQGPHAAAGLSLPQFNMMVVPPKDNPRDSSPVDDYVNASYVQPLGTRKRYIATQGPLPATFVDFWTLVWEQNVHVIVMLTREIENAMVKCGTYWTDSSYGPLQLQLLSTSPPISPSASANTPADAGFFMSPRECDKGSKQPSMIVRTFALSHRGYPAIPPRKVTHLQYLEWPDMNVPDDPRGVLELVKRVERAVQESTPGPSPCGSYASGSGSLSPCSGSSSRSFEMGRGEDFFSSPPLGDAGSKRKSGRRGWRHPELDSKTGVATFALGHAPPVLLHCSAGVGRTGGFIAVDAVLDATRREMNQRREIRARARAGVGVNRKGSVSVVGESGSGSGTESGGMDVDAIQEKDQDQVQEQNKEKIVGTVPLVMGDRKKSRRQGETNSSESLVVHVPFTGMAQDADAGEQTKDRTSADLDTRWQSSTREWAEQVLDQTHPVEGEAETELPPPLPISMSLSLPIPSRDRSPGSASNSSAPSALNSADDSVESGSSIDVGVKAGSGSVSGSRKSGGSSGSGAFPPSSSVSISHSGSRSNSGPGSISVSNSGSGTNTSSNSGFWGSTESSGLMGLMRSRLRDSSVTSLSNMGSDFSSEKPRMSLHKPSALRDANEDEDPMDVDRPPRSSSAPLQPAKSHVNNLNLHPRARQIIGSSPIASFSTPALPTTSGVSGGAFFEGDDPLARTSSNPSSDELLSPQRGFESGGSADVEAGSGKSSQVSSDESEENVVSSKIGLRLTAATTPTMNAASGQETTTKPSTIPKPKGISKAKSAGHPAPFSMPPVPELVEEKIPDAKLAPSELDKRAAGHAVIDYKLPRQLHQDLSPSPLMSHVNPIWTVVQDMREQRMSLCQSLRQYVFVHAAVIEGALMMVDEERELWGESTGSEGSPEPAYASNISEEGRRLEDSDIRKTPSVNMGRMEISGMRRTQGFRDRTRSSPAVGGLSSASSSSGGQIPLTTVSTSSVVSSSPSKWKRGPSPTELLKEDKSGTVLFAKRPTFNRRTPSDEQVLAVFDLVAGTPQALPSGTGGVSTVESGNTTHPSMGPIVPQQGGTYATAKQ